LQKVILYIKIHKILGRFIYKIISSSVENLNSFSPNFVNISDKITNKKKDIEPIIQKKNESKLVKPRFKSAKKI